MPSNVRLAYSTDTASAEARALAAARKAEREERMYDLRLSHYMPAAPVDRNAMARIAGAK